MAKQLSSTDIGASDMVEYLNGCSDFSFELQILKLLRGLKFQCEHNGLYEDPVSGKIREFDIRATKQAASISVHLAIECKNLKNNFPLLVSRIPRHESESFHSTFIKQVYVDPVTQKPNQLQSETRCVKWTGYDSLYKPRDFVGKDLNQIGREKSGTLTWNDSEVYEKWGQCLSSVEALVHRARFDCRPLSSINRSTVFPIVVVPDGRLWQVDFNDDGDRISEPTQTEHCNMFVNRLYEIKDFSPYFSVSHIDIMTKTGLINFIQDHLQDERYMNEIFPQG